MSFSSYIIPRRSSCCQEKQEPLAPGEEIVSALVIAKEGETLRCDYCVSCWQEVGQQKHGDDFFWRGKIPPKEAPLPCEGDRKEDGVLHLLKELVQESAPTPDKKRTLLVLALYLERRKSLIKCGERKGQIFYEVPLTQEVLVIDKVDLLTTDLGSLEKWQKFLEGPRNEAPQVSEQEV